MKLSELIKQAQAVLDKSGDLLVELEVSTIDENIDISSAKKVIVDGNFFIIRDYIE